MAVVDMHCDTISRLYQLKEEGKDVNLFNNDINIDINKLKTGNYLLQNFAMFVSLKETKDPYNRAHQYIDYYYQELEKYADYIKPVYCYQDIENNQKNHLSSAMLTLEEGAVINNVVN